MLVNADQLDTSQPDCVVDGILPRVGVVVAHGPSYSGKSLALGTELALAVANGTPWFGHRARHGSVVYALGEGLYDCGIRKAARLARQVADDAGTDNPPAYTDERLFIETGPFMVPVGRDGKATVEMASALAAMRALPDLELVILDAAEDFMGGLSISNRASANRLMMGLKLMVSELDCCVMLINHDRQDGKAMIGSGRLFAAADAVIAVKREDDPAGIPGATIISEKAKGAPEFDPVSFAVEPASWETPELGDDGRPTGGTVTVTSATVRLRNTPAAPGIRLPGSPLPQIHAVPSSRKRNGLRVVATPPAALSGPCNECGAPASRACNPLPGSAFATVDGQAVHDSRVA